VEFAMVAPIFLTMVFGIVEFGRLVMVQQVITNASREGSRRGVIDGASTDDVETAVNNYLSGAAISSSTVTVSPNPPSSAGFGQPITVTVQVAYDDVSWLPAPFLVDANSNLTASSVMSRESIP
jgi:Flp pilus assembly protein TadG